MPADVFTHQFACGPEREVDFLITRPRAALRPVFRQSWSLHCHAMPCALVANRSKLILGDLGVSS